MNLTLLLALLLSVFLTSSLFRAGFVAETVVPAAVLSLKLSGTLVASAGLAVPGACVCCEPGPEPTLFGGSFLRFSLAIAKGVRPWTVVIRLKLVTKNTLLLCYF